MTDLTRKLLNERIESWGIFYGDVQVGTISGHLGSHGTQQWQWSCGFYPGCGPGDHSNGNAPEFEQAREQFQHAWELLLPKKNEADFQEWRDHKAWTDRKYALWDAGKQLPAGEWESGKPMQTWMKCPCGEIFDTHSLEANLVHIPHIEANRSKCAISTR